MPRNGSGVYSKPPGTTFVPNTIIESAKVNEVVDDLVADANNARPPTAGGTGANTVAGARQNLTTFTTKASGYTAAASDAGAVHRCTATMTVALTAASSVAANWSLTIIADGGDVTIDPNASETIDGRTTLTVRNGSTVTVYCDGSSFRTSLSADQRVQKGYIYGLTLSNNATDATNDIDISSGEVASDGTIPYLMVLGATLTKRLDATWAVGSGNGGLDTGAITNGTYHLFLIQRSDTGVVDALFSNSVTAPTMPANYDRKRRIGSIIRNGGTILAFVQRGDHFDYVSALTDRSSTAAQASTLLSIGVPFGIVVQPKISTSQQQNAVGNVQTFFGSAGGPIFAATITTAAGEASSATINGGIFTDTSSRVQFAVTIFSGSLSLNTLNTTGWIDTRGRI